MAYEVFQEDDDGRRVYARATTVLTPYVFATERPRRISPEERETLTRFLEPEERVAAGQADPGPPRQGRSLPGPRPVLRRRRLRPRQQREVLRVLPGVADPADGPALARHGRGATAFAIVVAQTDVDYKLPILFRPEPYDAWSWISHVGNRSMTIESEICDGETVLSRARVVRGVLRPRDRAGDRAPGGVQAPLLAAPAAEPAQPTRRARRPRWCGACAAWPAHGVVPPGRRPG